MTVILTIRPQTNGRQIVQSNFDRIIIRRLSGFAFPFCFPPLFSLISSPIHSVARHWITSTPGSEFQQQITNVRSISFEAFRRFLFFSSNRARLKIAVRRSHTREPLGRASTLRYYGSIAQTQRSYGWFAESLAESRSLSALLFSSRPNRRRLILLLPLLDTVSSGQRSSRRTVRRLRFARRVRLLSPNRANRQLLRISVCVCVFLNLAGLFTIARHRVSPPTFRVLRVLSLRL